MLRNISTLQLAGILIILVLVYLAFLYFDDGGRSRSFRDNLVGINAESVTSIALETGSQDTYLKKEGSQWTVTLPSGKTVPAVASKVTSMLSTLETIEPSRIVTRNPEKWSEYNVDSTGTRVVLSESGSEVLDLVIGRFGMKNQQQMFTYVRLADEDEVYVADDFMSFSVSGDANSYRNQELLRLTPDSLSAIRFQYPDSAFVLQRTIDNKWAIDNRTADSASVASFIQGVRNLNSNKFDDDLDLKSLTPVFSLLFNQKGLDDISVSVYKNEDNLLFNSSHNPDALFRDENIAAKLLKGKDDLITD
jgi:hypothetical protein